MSNSATSNKHLPLIAVTPGEPAGIGPDLAIAVAAHPKLAALNLVFFCDPQMLRERASRLGATVEVEEIALSAASGEATPGTLRVIPVAAPAAVTAGSIDTANAAYVLRCLDGAIDACREGRVAAVVTGPVHKAAIIDAGYAFSGHTEYFAERLDADLPVMMLASAELRVALVTTHHALSAVPALVRQQRIVQVVGIVDHDLRCRFGIRAPRIAVCGLNPHAGEEGHLGREELEEITPALEQLCDAGIDVAGPLPADTIFAPSQREGFDAIVAMYHDQGLAALKAVGFGHTVNITLGLPIIRTSVDHGTALSLAGTGQADPGSLVAAIGLAAELAARPGD